MRGGENFGINNVSYGNIIIALNSFKYYIKLKYKDITDNAKSGIYYFVFDINNNNQLASSFGLTNSLIVNGNINNRESKTFLDLSLGKDKQFSLSLKGNAYKSTNSDTLNEIDGIPSVLVIGIKKNEIPTFTLNFFSGDFKQLGDKGLSIESLDNDIESFKEAYDKITEEPESREVPVELASKIFRTIFQFSKQLATNPDSINKWYNYLDKFKDNYGDLLIEKNPELNTLYQRALGRIQNIRTPKQPVEKPVVEPVKKPAKKPVEKPVPQPLTSKELLNLDYYNFDVLAIKFYNSIRGDSENEEYKEFSKNAFLKLKDFLTENNFLTGNKINDKGKVITILYQAILRKYILTYKQIYNDEDLNGILNSLLKIIKSNPDLNTSNVNTYVNTNKDFIFQQIGKIKMNGGGNNTTVIIENNTDNLNISEFGEPVIYIKSSKKSGLNISGFGKDANKIPVFGYLTVGKELLLKLLSMQTNNNVSFEAPAGTYESAITYLANYAKANPVIAIAVATFLTNGLTKAMAESGIPGVKSFPHIKDIVTSICTNIFGDWVGPYLTSFMPSADRTKSTVWSQIWPKQTGNATIPSDLFNTTIPNSTRPQNTGGKSRKIRKSRKSRKNKKITRRNTRRNKKYLK